MGMKYYAYSGYAPPLLGRRGGRKSIMNKIHCKGPVSYFRSIQHKARMSSASPGTPPQLVCHN